MQIVFNQGDEGDMMYIILRGSVHVLIKGKDEKQIHVATLYDGQSFGELALFSSNQAVKAKRLATIQTSEHTELLAVNREDFRDIIMSLKRDELESKIQILKLLPFFEVDFLIKKCEEYTLIPLANLLKKQTYKLGEIIIRTGQVPKGLYIVQSGLCKVVKEELVVRKMNSSEKSMHKEPFGFIRESTHSKISQTGKSLRRQPTKMVYEESKHSSSSNRLFTNLVIEVNPSENKMAYIELTEQGQYVAGQFFGNKTVVNYAYKITPKADIKKQLLHPKIQDKLDKLRSEVGKSEEEEQMENKEGIETFMNQDATFDVDAPAKLSVISDNCQTELLILERESIQYVPDKIKGLLLNGLNADLDFDELDMETHFSNYRFWNQYKIEEFTEEMKRVNNLKSLTKAF